MKQFFQWEKDGQVAMVSPHRLYLEYSCCFGYVETDKEAGLSLESSRASWGWGRLARGQMRVFLTVPRGK